MLKNNSMLEDLTAGKRTSTWKNKFDYILSLLGLMVGYGNLWRFPYLCYKHGGGAFLIAYWIIAVFLILPLVILESALGQYTAHSPAKAWAIVPLFKGIGFAMMMLMTYLNGVYPLLLTWTLRWLVASFSMDMPWTTCNHVWNGNNCFPLMYQDDNATSFTLNMYNISTIAENNVSKISSVDEFWRNYILGLPNSSGIEDLGGIKWDLFACLTVIWILTYFSIWKGISWTSKIVAVTATLPIAMILVVVVRGVTLEGAGKGISAYLKPDISRLLNVELWTDATSQVLFSVGSCCGGFIALSAYNKFNHNLLRDSLILMLLNGAASFLSGFAIFSVLGFLAHTQNITLSEVADSGPGLVFVVYPTALSLIPIPQLWFILFFIMLLLLGYDSQFVVVESLLSCIEEQFPFVTKDKWSKEIYIAVVCFIEYLLGVLMVTYGGMYVFNIFNTYTLAGWVIYFVAMSEMICIGWAYGADRMCQNIEQMVGFAVPRVWLKITWKFLGPGIFAVLMIYYSVYFRPLEYESSYVYPLWATVVGWITILSIALCIPLGMIHGVWKANGRTIFQKLKSSLTPTIYHSRRKIQDEEEHKVLNDSKI